MGAMIELLEVEGNLFRTAHCDGVAAVPDESSWPRGMMGTFSNSCQFTFCD